jgi:DHA2 family multidrug resistance protein
VLEEGTAKDWFQDETITWCAIISSVGGVIFFYRAFTAATPIVDLKAFSNRNFASGCLASFTIGIGLYGLTYLYPVFLARVRGYTSLEIGETMFLTGVAMFFTAPFAGRLSAKLDPRVMLAIGIFGFAIGTFLASTLTKDWGFHELIWPQIFRGVSLMFCMVPINNVALGTLPPERLKNASGLFNLTRNLGGAVGLALINTLMNDRWDFHLHTLREKIIWGRQVADETLANITQGFSTLGDNAALAATKQLSLLARREALVLALGDVFLALTFIFLLMLIVLPAIKRASPARGGGGGH